MPRGAPPLRIGQGWDIHRLVPGRPLLLAGVRIPHDRGLLGHSDGDIGQHFPDTDPRYRGADSATLLAEVVRIVAARRGQVVNADVTILAERPKLAPHMPAMRSRLAELLGVDEARVGLKARTMEGLGAIGAGEAIAAQAVVLVALSAARRAVTRPASRRRGR